MKPLLTEKEMAAQISCCARTMANLRTRRLIPYTKIGRMVRYDPEAVSAALRKLTVKEVG
jgi:hypothetical protein